MIDVYARDLLSDALRARVAYLAPYLNPTLKKDQFRDVLTNRNGVVKEKNFVAFNADEAAIIANNFVIRASTGEDQFAGTRGSTNIARFSA